MTRYRRAKIEGGTFFFTVTLADRSTDLLVRHIDGLRRVYMSVRDRYPFDTIAICVLPDHLHAVWSLPPGDANFSLRWNLIKSGFSRGLPANRQRSSSKIRRHEKGIWQRRYWEHAIRDDTDLERHIDYIATRSSMDTCLVSTIGLTAVSDVMLRVVSFRRTGAATFRT
jgi:putative transposase